MERPSQSAYAKPVDVLQSQVYQFKISLIGIAPPIWRIIQVPSDYGFYALHSAIQDVFGWEEGTQFYSFETFSKRPEVESILLPLNAGVPCYESDPLITTYFTSVGDNAFYIYDDQWPFHIVLEKIVDRSVRVRYPVCISGERCCARKKVDGIKDYNFRLRIAADPNHPKHSLRVKALARTGHSEHFSLQAVVFKDPKERFKCSHKTTTINVSEQWISIM